MRALPLSRFIPFGLPIRIARCTKQLRHSGSRLLFSVCALAELQSFNADRSRFVFLGVWPTAENGPPLLVSPQGALTTRTTKGNVSWFVGESVPQCRKQCGEGFDCRYSDVEEVVEHLCHKL